MAFSVYIQSTGLNILLSQTVSKVCYSAIMADDDDFNFGGRTSKRSGSQGSPKTRTSKGSAASQPIVKLGSLSGGSMSFKSYDFLSTR